MDAVSFISRLAVEALPPSAAAHLLDVASTVQGRARDALYMVLDTSGDDARGHSDSAVPLITALAALAIAFLVALWAARLVLFWTRLIFRAALWATLLVGCALIWMRGLGPCLRDAVVVAAKAMGFLAVLKDVWIEAYARYKEQQIMAQTAGAGSWDS